MVTPLDPALHFYPVSPTEVLLMEIIEVAHMFRNVLMGASNPAAELCVLCKQSPQ